jgi:hypothetical protein
VGLFYGGLMKLVVKYRDVFDEKWGTVFEFVELYAV